MKTEETTLAVLDSALALLMMNNPPIGEIQRLNEYAGVRKRELEEQRKPIAVGEQRGYPPYPEAVAMAKRLGEIVQHMPPGTRLEVWYRPDRMSGSYLHDSSVYVLTLTWMGTEEKPLQFFQRMEVSADMLKTVKHDVDYLANIVAQLFHGQVRSYLKKAEPNGTSMSRPSEAASSGDAERPK